MPRHSSGCRNCVRRHILCDESYPTCKNCESRALTCDGRREGFQFVHVIHSLNPTPPRKSNLHWSRTRSHKVPLSFFEPSQPSISRELPGSYDFKPQFCFLLATLEREDSVWLKYYACDPASYPISGLAIEALCTAKFAKRYRDGNLLAVAAGGYTKALSALRHGLNNSYCYDFDILAAITALNRYELLVCTLERSWVKHAGGLSKVIELMGPEKFSKHPYNAILASNRFRIIHEAYYRRKPTFLQQNRWQCIRTPASNIYACFDQMEDFYGTLTEVAALVTAVIQHGDAREERQASSLVENLVHDLDQWMVDWKAKRKFDPERKANDINDSFYSDAEGLVFADSLLYPDPIDAVVLNLCRALKLTTLEWQQKLEQPQWWSGAANQNMVDIPQARPLARDICRSLHLYFDSQHPNLVLHVSSLLFCAIIAHKAFRRNSREMRWLQKMLERVADLTGVEVARSFISCYENKWSPH